ncbi:MAG: arylesterase [Croceitalea sp.]|nr:arylesterase [Croceitalea sp.]NNC35671.1 arylesterase [Croceitalea sp.]NNM17673.1 arylesterase [Croceitalea sp.]
MQTFLKFRYFLVFFLVCGCGDAPKKEATSEDPQVAEENQDTTNQSKGKVIMFFGDSLTAGYGLEMEEAFPALIQERLDSLQLDYTVINSGLSGETTSGGLNRLNWVLNQNVDIFVLELGANDGLRGIPLNETKSNLVAMIELVRSKNKQTKIILVGMQIPPNMGPEYTSEFRKLFPNVAAEKDVALIPFLLDGVAGNPELNLEDGIHPTAKGHQIVKETVWDILKNQL